MKGFVLKDETWGSVHASVFLNSFFQLRQGPVTFSGDASLPFFASV